MNHRDFNDTPSHQPVRLKTDFHAIPSPIYEKNIVTPDLDRFGNEASRWFLATGIHEFRAGNFS